MWAHLLFLVCTFLPWKSAIGFNGEDPHNCSAQCTSALQPLSDTAPNVLVFGDSISAANTGYYYNLQAMLENNISQQLAKVQHTGGYGKGICGTSYGALACMPSWVGTAKNWTTIAFNWGLHDICPEMYAPVTTAEYISNMGAMLKIMRGALAPGGTLVWSSTTPVPPSYAPRNNSDVVIINAAMAKLLALPENRDIVVNDLYSQVVERCNRNPSTKGYPESSDCEFLQSNGVHFSPAGKQYTGLMVASAFLPYL
eukprot:m.9036 g.9036  ORF g.9036 m.9036 type:complete len:255 (-) comp6819_c0_seq1:310-1074(-)